MEKTKSISLKTPVGILQVEGDAQGLSKVYFPGEKQDNHSLKEIPDELREAVFQIQSYLKGDLKEFNLQLNPKGSDFQQKVWKALLDIPYGKTISYLQLAKNIGNEKAVRAVAAANGKNPLSIIIPCHRVIGNDGSLTGYSGGLSRKKWLLEHENALKQTSLF